MLYCFFLLKAGVPMVCILEGNMYLASFSFSLCWLRYTCMSQVRKSATSFPGPWLRMGRTSSQGRWDQCRGVVVSGRVYQWQCLEWAAPLECLGCVFGIQVPLISAHVLNLVFQSSQLLCDLPNILKKKRVLLCFSQMALTLLLQTRTYVTHKACLGKVYGEGKNMEEKCIETI